MDTTLDTRQLRAAIDALASFGVVPAIAQPLQQHGDSIAQELRAAIVADVPAFTESGNPDVLPELLQHLEEHVAEVCRLLAGSSQGDLGFIRAHAQRRAEQKFPLDALLNGYRCIHRILLRRIRDAALETANDAAHVRRVVAAVSDFVVEYAGAAGALTTSEYVLHTRRLAEAESDRRTELLNFLLSGYDESDARAAQALRRSGYLAQRQSFCVVVARSVNPREMENVARAQRMSESIGATLRELPIRSLIGIRDNVVTIVLSGTRRLSGWTAARSLLADRVYPQLRKVGPAALIGLSNDAPSTSHIPRALAEARLALDFASVSERVMPYSQIPFRRVMVRLTHERIGKSLPAWTDDLLDADRKSRHSLIATLQAYADADMNVLRTAKVMSLHPNTIYARMQRIRAITGKDALAYHDLTELLLVAETVGESRQ